MKKILTSLLIILVTISAKADAYSDFAFAAMPDIQQGNYKKALILLKQIVNDDRSKYLVGARACAQFYIGRIYGEGGGGVKKDYVEMVNWIKLAAADNVVADWSNGKDKFGSEVEAGDLGAGRTCRTDAEATLGGIYRIGLGVIQDNATAYKWYHLASSNGDKESRYQLGIMYSNSNGLDQNLLKAHMWLNLSAMEGNAAAMKEREIIAKSMTYQQIAEAQKMAINCQNSNFKNCD
jgi:TPR repeat protein